MALIEKKRYHNRSKTTPWQGIPPQEQEKGRVGKIAPIIISDERMKQLAAKRRRLSDESLSPSVRSLCEDVRLTGAGHACGFHVYGIG
jgi:hypothetical protein